MALEFERYYTRMAHLNHAYKFYRFRVLALVEQFPCRDPNPRKAFIYVSSAIQSCCNTTSSWMLAKF